MQISASQQSYATLQVKRFPPPSKGLHLKCIVLLRSPDGNFWNLIMLVRPQQMFADRKASDSAAGPSY